MKKAPAPADKIDSTRGTHGAAAAARAKESAPRQAAQAGAEAMTDGRLQSVTFDKAIALFRQGQFAQAQGLFVKAAAGPILDMGYAARAHARMCESRIGRAAPAAKTVEDHYNWGVALLNQGRFQEAEEHLHEAARVAPNADYIHYALALSRGLRGDMQRASESLQRAIEIQPKNRAQALSDPDFAGLVHQRPIAALLFSPREPET